MRISLFVLLFGSLISTSLHAQEQNKQGARYPQTSFGEGRVRHPVKLPAAARRALNASTTMKNFDPEFPCEFTASAIDLNDDSINDYVVSNCIGTDNAHYWVVWHDRAEYHVVFDYGLSILDVLKTKTSGFYDIRTKWDVAAQGSTELWKFSNGKYRIARQWYRKRRQE